MIDRLRALAVTAARSAARLVPDGVLARVLPGSLGWRGALAVAQAPATPIRLLVGPVNSAGQGYLWARAAEQELPGVGAVDLMTTTRGSARFSFPADVSVPEGAYVFAAGWQRRQRAAIVSGFTHLLLESGRFPYGSVPGSTPLRAVRGLLADGVAVALLWHGSDIRVPSEHAAAVEDSPFGPHGAYPAASTAVLERNAVERLRLVTETDLPVFVSTPGLLGVPRAQWLPVVVDPERWASADEPLRRDVPVVAYVPSNSPMKGDPSVDVQLRALEGEGLIVYRRLQDIPAADMPAVYRDADIVLDQFRLGDYGVAACEAMAAGRVVIGHVAPAVRAHVRRATGLDLPIRESRFADVGATVRAVIADRDGARVDAGRGPAFVAAVHAGTLSARVLAPFLGVDAPPQETS